MIRLLSRKDVESVLTMKDCLAAVEAAFGELAREKALMPQRSVIKIQEHAGLCLGMPAFIGGEVNAVGLKFVTVYPNNPSKHDLPTTLGTLLLCDPATGKAVAVMDAGYLTAVRTGAASGVATRYLARDDTPICTIFGAGVQARKQLEAIALVRKLEQVNVLDLAADTRDRFASEMSDLLGIQVTGTEDAETAVREADRDLVGIAHHVVVGQDVAVG